MGQYAEQQETDSHPATLKPRTAAARSGVLCTTTTLDYDLKPYDYTTKRSIIEYCNKK